MVKKALGLTFVLIFIFLVVPPSAYAYLDPGSGSYLIQIIIASVAGAGYLIRANWKTLKENFLKRSKKKTKNGKGDRLS